jgi:hypothetical protein
MKVRTIILAGLPLLLLTGWWLLEPSTPRSSNTPAPNGIPQTAAAPTSATTSPAPQAAAPAAPGETVWQLSEASVLRSGHTVTVPEGILSSGHTLEAVATNPADGAQGKVQIVFSAFRPAQDMAGQKAGRWYISGDWRFVGDVAAASNLPTTRNGLLRAELDFNPAETPGQIAAQLWTSRLRSGVRPTRVAGTFVGNHKFEGQLRFGGPGKTSIKPNA